MKKILYISMCYPYMKANHAGGKTVAYYAQRFAQESETEVKIICKLRESEKKEYRKQENIYPVSMPDNLLNRGLAYILSINSKINPFSKYENTITKYIRNGLLNEAKRLKNEGYVPDVIILEWTEMVLLINKVKEIFPNSFIVSSEHDIKIQSLKRKWEAEKKWYKKIIKHIRLDTIRTHELAALRKSNLIVVQSEKDKLLLKKMGIVDSKILVISPYFMHSERHWEDNDSKNIVLYGNMSREENYLSAIWFIENVFKKIDNFDIGLIVLGGNPPKKLMEYASDRIIVTGYIENVFDYLEKCYCMVVPLQLGAGIKVKCLEALDYGIPLITNAIGIEGIGATEGSDYILCETAEEFRKAVLLLFHDPRRRAELSEGALNYAHKYLDLEKAYRGYKEKINV